MLYLLYFIRTQTDVKTPSVILGELHAGANSLLAASIHLSSVCVSLQTVTAD